jgi:hypothetical protein
MFHAVAFSAQNVTLYIDETTTAKTESGFMLTVYGSSESEDFFSHKWQSVDIEIKDAKGNTVDDSTETAKNGMWEFYETDISSLSDGNIEITATMHNQDGAVLASITHGVFKDTSFSFNEFLQNNLALMIFLLMVVLLLLGFPMKIPLIAGTTLGIFLLFQGDFSQMQFMVQQMMAGIRPAALIAVPMFILSADIMTRGHSAEKLIDLVMAFVRHVKGGLAISTAGACTMFGAVSGSTQATVVAVGSPLRPRLKKGGYKDS